MGRIPIPSGPTGPCGVRAGATAWVLVALVAATLLPSMTANASSGAAGAGSGADPGAGAGGPGQVLVVNVSGLIDPVLADFIERSITSAERADTRAVVLQLNSSGAVVSDERLAALATRLRDATVPVTVWVGTSGAEATGGAAELVAVAAASGMAPGTRLGRIGDQRLPVEDFGVLFGEHADRLAEGTVDEETALELGVITAFPPVPVTGEGPAEAGGDDPVAVGGAPTVGDFIVNLEGVETREVTQGDQVRREPVTVVRFTRLSLLDQLAHTVASPAVAYLLMAVGLALLVFELYTAGVGIAGLVGAGCVVAGSYGWWVLPTNLWAAALVVLSFLAFAIDVQTGVPRVWTAIGSVAFVVGSFGLYAGLPLPWITLLVAVVGVVLTFLVGMPAMVRTRFSTPTIGREWLVGEAGEALTGLDPRGVVRIRGAPWRAETSSATSLEAGASVRVVAVDRLLLEVEPAVPPAKSPAPDPARTS